MTLTTGQNSASHAAYGMGEVNPALALSLLSKPVLVP